MNKTQNITQYQQKFKTKKSKNTLKNAFLTKKRYKNNLHKGVAKKIIFKKYKNGTFLIMTYRYSKY